MYIDAFTLSALVDEFMDTLVGGRIQDSVSVDDTAIGLEIYADHRRRYLYVSADQRTPRVHLVADKLRRGVQKPTQVALLIRRLVEGGTITHVSQPAWERILMIDIDGAEGEVTLVVEPMERRSNLLLVRAGVILDCLRRVGPDENRYRVSLPNHPYILPPPQTGKLDPTQIGRGDLYDLIEANDDPKKKAHQLLTAHLLGMSPLLSKEVVFRAAGTAEARAADAEADALYEAMQTLLIPLARREWQPGVAEGDGGRGVQAYSVYPLAQMHGWRRVETVSAAMSLYYGAPVGEEAYSAGKEPLREALREARAKHAARLASLERSLTDEREREVLRQSGELILAYQYTLTPGQTELRAQYDADAPELAIALDPKLTPLENAQRYFDRYNRAKRALDDVPALIEAARADLAQVAQLESDLELASNWTDIDEVQQAVQAQGWWRGKPLAKIGGGRSAPLKVSTPEGFVIWIGRNSRQNELVTFDKGGVNDLWLHARDVPGAHVIIKSDGRPVPETVIERAAALAAYYSPKRGEGRVIVDVTERRYVRKVKGGATGLVTYRNETTRTVAPRSERELAEEPRP